MLATQGGRIMLIRARSACGFSLIELLLVVAVLAMAAAFSLPALRGTMSAYRLRASADTIAGELEAARIMAISRGAAYQVKFTSRTVYVSDPQDPSTPPRVPKTLEDGVSVSAGPTITFKARGTCSSGLIQIQNSDSNVASINLDGTGKITVYVTGLTSD
jgi:prepilin-type N-terminal cleavage/methylation domain-containing protein